jgi:hypothetical protein
MNKLNLYSSLIQLIGDRDITFLESITKSVGNNNGRDVNMLCNKILSLEINKDEKKQFIHNLYNFKNNFFPFIVQTEDMILHRYDLFIKNFSILQTTNEIVNGIKLLYILLNHYKYHFLNLKPIVFEEKYKFEENRSLKNIFEKWLNDLKIEQPSKYVDNVNQNFKDAIKNLLIRKLYNKTDSCITYGSFSLFLYDNTINFNDIDLYAKDTYYYLICLIGMVYFSTGKELSINAIPYVEGLRIIRDETKYDINLNIDSNLFDCIHMDESIFNRLTYVTHNNIKILDPKIQLIQSIRQLSVFERRYKIYYDYDKMLKSLLYYTYLSDIEFKIRAIPTYVWQFRMNNKYNDIKELKKTYPNLVSLLTKEPSFFKIVIDGITYITIINYNHNDKMHIDNFVYGLFPTVEKKSMKFASLFNEDVYEGKDIIVMTNSTLETYFNNDFELTILSVIAFISSYVLYNILHKKNVSSLFNLVYTLIQQKVNSANWKIERFKNTKEQHKTINFARLLFTSLIVHSEPLQFIEKNNINGMIRQTKT